MSKILGWFFLIVMMLAGDSIVMARPNVVVIMTDDQDDSGSITTMPSVQELAKNGVTFRNSFVDFPLCTPSRATFMTGQTAHNNEILGNNFPLGGYKKFALRENNSLGVWLQNAGYVTGLIGKFMNNYGKDGTDLKHVVPGWDDWHGILDGGDSIPYFNFTINENGELHRYGNAPRDYITDVLARKATQFIHASAHGTKPFFLLVTPIAPHETNSTLPGPIPAPRDDGTLHSLPFPNEPNFNEADVSDKPGWIRALPLLDKKGIARNIEEFRRRRESLLAVDDLVRDVVSALDNEGVLNNTIVIFTSDNGWSQGAHRWTGKLVPYEESIRVPLVVRWPGMPQDQVRDQLVTNVDVVATIIEQTQATPGNKLDGRSLTSIIRGADVPWRTAFFVQGISINQDLDLRFLAVRTKEYFYSAGSSTKYGNKAEFYDLAVDPYEDENRAGNANKRVIAFLRAVLKQLSTCIGENCWVTAKPPP